MIKKLTIWWKKITRGVAIERECNSSGKYDPNVEYYYKPKKAELVAHTQALEELVRKAVMSYR